MNYGHRARQANDIPDDSGEPYELTILRLRNIIELQAREITRLQAVVHQLEQSPVGYIYDRNANVRADGAYQE